MPILLGSASIIQSVGTKPKQIEEFVGRVNSATNALSIARMTSPGGWEEPGQTPDFDEYSIVLEGVLRVETKSEIIDVKAGQGIIVGRGEWVRYSTPAAQGATYIAVCAPAFSADAVHRDVPPKS